MKGTTRLNLRLDKASKNGKCPIEIIYSVRGQRKYIYPGVSVFPEQWDEENQKFVYFAKKSLYKIAARFKAYRIANSISIKQLSKELHIDKNVITQIEKGMIKPSSDILKALYQKYKIDPNIITKGTTSDGIAILPDRQFDSLADTDDISTFERIISEALLQLERIEKKFEVNDIPFSAEMVAGAFKESKTGPTKKESSSKLVYEFIDRYIIENAPSRAKGSLGVYKSLRTHLQAFEAHTKRKVRFDEINYAFFQSFHNFLIEHKTEKGKTLNNITIAKQLSTLKTFLGYARKHGIVTNDSYRDYRVSRQDLEVIALTEREFLTLYHLDLSDNSKKAPLSFDEQGNVIKWISYESLAKVRDVFCFSCTMGLRYSDLAQLRWNHIKTTEIKITVKKTKKPLIVPINGYAEEILSRYKDCVYPLPVISNQKYNDYIKALCRLAEINGMEQIIRLKGAKEISTFHPKYELISAHTGRKTFCTLSLERGVPAETVMATSGHHDYKSFKRYVKITEERKRNEMQKAWGAPKILKIVNK
ncbi:MULTISPECIES: phage integrase SAM-like domain-containing protein [Olivibacter]|uniref:Phage integrase SAM-like domain-containing protein n=1 Tax=Olivibacter jilunii TaxID=985016 RepID=A0ABW6AYE0_9SPHI